MDIRFYYVKPEYIEYLKAAEINARGFTCVPNTSYSNNDKFFYGAVFTAENGMEYFVPVSHKTAKDPNSVLIKTKDKTNAVKGSLRFAYMIPVPHEMLTEMVIKELTGYDRQRRVMKELAFCRRNRDKLTAQAAKTYNSVIHATSKKLKDNSCDFLLLEESCAKFCEIHIHGKNSLDKPHQQV